MRTSRFEEQQRCYCAVTVGAVAAVGSVAIAGASAYESNKNQQAQTAALSKQPKVAQYNPVDPNASFDSYESYRQNVLPYAQADAQQQNDVNNSAYQRELGMVNPALISNIGTQGQNANDLLNGRIPADVQAQVQRSSAYQALTGQGSTDSGSAHALTARDLGTTSLALQQQGSNMLAGNLAATQAVNPYNATGDQSILSASQFLARDDQNAALKAAIANKNAQIGFQNSIYQTAANSYNPAGAGVTSGLGALSGLANNSNFTSGVSNMFGNGNPYANSYNQQQQTALSGYYNPYLNSALYDANGNFTGGG